MFYLIEEPLPFGNVKGASVTGVVDISVISSMGGSDVSNNFKGSIF